jgi:cytochrome P450
LKVAARALLIFRTLKGELNAAEDRDDTIMGSLKQAIRAGTLHTKEATAILHTLLSAGGESTTSLIGNAVRILAENPELQQQLRDQPAQITKFLEEVLRMESPFRYQLRSVPRATQLGAVDIPSGSTLLMFYGAGNRDPDAFDRPDELDLSRPVRHIAFGRGIHMCIGAPLARLESRTVIKVLLEKTSSITLDPGKTPRWVESLQVRRHEYLPVRLIRR